MTRPLAKSKIWVVLTFGGDRQHAGNAGYDDAPERYYSYDSFVANHRQVAAGDCLLLCNREKALGIACIMKIDAVPSTRVLHRCPTCGDTGIKKRRTKSPLYRCKKGHEFEEPAAEIAECTKYTAHFGETFKPFIETFGRSFLRQGCPRYSDQVAMQEFDFALIEAELRSSFPHAASLIPLVSSGLFLPAETADDKLSLMEGYKPTEGDEREKILRQIRARRGQQAFRDELRIRYGDQCVVSGCRTLHVLEAAHIRPYRGEPDNHPDNGLLLRADIHTLFDLDLIGVEPVSLTIHVHPTVNSREYKDLNGRALYCSGRRPSEEALEGRWKAFKIRLQAN